MITKLYADNPDYRIIDIIAGKLRDGELIIFSTGLSYALGCSAVHSRAIEAVYRLKSVDLRRQRFAIICSNLASAAQYARIDQHAFLYIKSHFYEPITYLLPPLSSLPKVLKSSRDIGVRFVHSPEIKLLLEMISFPLLTASLPIKYKDREYLIDPELVNEAYGKDVYTVINGGILPGGCSAIVRLSEGKADVLREAQDTFESQW